MAATMTRAVRLALAGAALLLPLAAAAQADATAERLARLERALNNKGLLDLVRQVELLQQEVRQLRGELENQVFSLEQLRKSQTASYVDVDRRLGRLEQGGIISVAPGAAAAATGESALDPPLPTLNAPAGTSIAGAPAGAAMALDVQSPQGLPAAPGDSAMTVDDAGLDVEAAGEALAALAPAPAPGAATEPAATAVPVAPTPSLRPAPAGVDSPESEAAYRDAFGMLKAGQYEDSIAAFNSFMQLYPGSQYADNAQYWLGEAYYVMRQFEPAIEQYQQLVRNYPDSKKQSHAMLKIAYSYYELGLTDQAMSVLGELKTRFPGSAAARLADERIQRIRAEAR